MLDLCLEVFAFDRSLVGIADAEIAEARDERYHSSRTSISASEHVARLLEIFSGVTEAEVFIGEAGFRHGKLAFSKKLILREQGDIMSV